ncbi:DUF4384 domain-containing protein [Marivita sp. S0852]|uniref:DUF4384 domain-containing protein n=1 Tax=Marivita sp. S0852 TaxID=3373893 RepID=UPI003981CD94
MKTTPAIWSLASVTSVAVHLVAAGVLMWMLHPDDMPDQPTPQTELQLSTYQVPRSRAQETPPTEEAAPDRPASGARTSPSVIPTSRATRIDTPSTRVTERMVDVAKAQTLAAPMQPARPDLQAPRQAASLVAPVSVVATASDVSAPPLASARLSAEVASSLSAVPISVAAVSIDRPPAQTLDLRQDPAPAIAAPDTVTAAVQPDSPTIHPDEAAAQNLLSLDPPQTRATASLAFPGAGDGPVDPVSLRAFQSFMQPDDPTGSAAELRDGLSGILNTLPCSRVQARFDPEANALVLSGHVPDAALRGTVLAAMQDQMGTDIPVREELLILPRPQCGALSGIARVGLPQSTDQITNPLLIGQGTHAIEFRYVAGQPLVLDLQGADYDAYVYVDYFDADGNVLHLVPNNFTPLTRTAAKAALRIGSERPLAVGEPGVFIRIGPPYGQEIAVAFASSVRLYDGVRPLIEPAGAYLDWLRQKVSDARADHADFKGEWVYFFVTTSEK